VPSADETTRSDERRWWRRRANEFWIGALGVALGLVGTAIWNRVTYTPPISDQIVSFEQTARQHHLDVAVLQDDLHLRTGVRSVLVVLTPTNNGIAPSVSDELELFDIRSGHLHEVFKFRPRPYTDKSGLIRDGVAYGITLLGELHLDQSGRSELIMALGIKGADAYLETPVSLQWSGIRGSFRLDPLISRATEGSNLPWLDSRIPRRDRFGLSLYSDSTPIRDTYSHLTFSTVFTEQFFLMHRNGQVFGVGAFDVRGASRGHQTAIGLMPVEFTEYDDQTQTEACLYPQAVKTVSAHGTSYQSELSRAVARYGANAVLGHCADG
jgi:hypothetical protein